LGFIKRNPMFLLVFEIFCRIPLEARFVHGLKIAVNMAYSPYFYFGALTPAVTGAQLAARPSERSERVDGLVRSNFLFDARYVVHRFPFRVPDSEQGSCR
jgi:hypothetical protein